MPSRSPATSTGWPRSARGLGLPEPDLDEVRRACAAVLAANPVPLGRLRITYTGGPARSAPTAATPARPWSSPSASPPAAPTPPPSSPCPWTRNERGALTGLKTTSYAENVVALARAREQGASEALFANTVGQLCEGTGSNVFVVLDGETAHPAARLRLPGRHHPRPDRRVGRRQGDRPAAGRPGAGRGGLPDLHPARRPGRAPGRRPRTARRTGPGHRQGDADLRGAVRRRLRP